MKSDTFMLANWTSEMLATILNSEDSTGLMDSSVYEFFDAIHYEFVKELDFLLLNQELCNPYNQVTYHIDGIYLNSYGSIFLKTKVRSFYLKRIKAENILWTNVN